MAVSWWLIPGDARALRYPDACACCNADTTARWDVVPYCDVCRAHVPAIGPWALAIGAIAIGGGGALALRSIAAFAPFFLHVAIVAAIAAAPVAIVAVVRARRGLGAPHAERAQAAEITRGGLLARSHAWAERVAELNGVVARETLSSSLEAAERVLPWAACVLPIAFVFVLWPTWHVELWIDNGTAAEVDVRADDHVVATVAAGEHERIELPRRRMTLAATGDRPIDLDPGDKKTWVFDVALAHCYMERAFTYTETGKSLFLVPPRSEQAMRARLFASDARWMFETPPHTITTERPRELRTFGETYYALEIVPCSGHRDTARPPS